MPYDVGRFAAFVGGLVCLVLPASAAEAQTRPHRFEIAAGTMYGFQDPERPLTVWHRFTLRLAADVPILAGGDYVVLRPKLSARVVVALGR